MIDTIARWREDHANFARLLDLLEAQLELFHRGGAPNYALMLDIVTYMTQYPDLCHHPHEDLAFAKIAERDAASRPVIEELLRQHESLRDSGDKLAMLLEEVLADALIARSEVEVPGRSYVECFRAHIRREEHEIFPVAARALSAADWKAVDAALQLQHDPLFGEKVEKRFESLHRQIALEAAPRLSA